MGPFLAPSMEISAGHLMQLFCSSLLHRWYRDTVRVNEFIKWPVEIPMAPGARNGPMLIHWEKCISLSLSSWKRDAEGPFMMQKLPDRYVYGKKGKFCDFGKGADQLTFGGGGAMGFTPEANFFFRTQARTNYFFSVRTKINFFIST